MNTFEAMKQLVLFFTFYIFFSNNMFSQEIPEKLNGMYCNKAGNIMAFCLTFEGDTFHSALASMMFGYAGKGTYKIKNDSLILYYCKGDSSYYVDRTTPSGTITKYKIKKATDAELIIKMNGEKKYSTLKKEKQ